MENQVSPSPLIVKRQGSFTMGSGGRAQPLPLAKPLLLCLSGLVAAMAVATVEQQAPDVVLQGVGVACRATPSAFG